MRVTCGSAFRGVLPQSYPAALRLPALIKLAGIDRGTQFPSDSAISPYGQVLDSLRGKCTNSRAELGDMSVGTQEMLADMGDPNSLLDILKMVDSVASTDLVMDCTDIFVILVVG